VSIVNSQIWSNTATEVRAHLHKFLLPPWETHVCSLFAGRRCQCQGWHSDHLIVHHQLEFGNQCTHSCSQVPIAQMGDSRFARCLQGGGVYVKGGTTVAISSCTISRNTAYSVRAHVQNFPSPPCGRLTCTRCLQEGGGVSVVTSVVGGTVTFSSCTISGNQATVVRAHVQKFPSP